MVEIIEMIEIILIDTKNIIGINGHFVVMQRIEVPTPIGSLMANLINAPLAVSNHHLKFGS